MYRLLTVISVAILTEAHGMPVEEKQAIATDDYPRYAFNYAVKDPNSYDDKAQWEERDGDVVNGGYSLREPDGSLRVVEYTANDAQGFNAVVKNVGPNVHPVTVTKAVAPAPVHIAPAAPLHINVPDEPILHDEPVIQPIHTPLVQSTHLSLDEPTHLPLIQPTHLPLARPIYGVAPALYDIPKSTILRKASLPWDPATGSYGGWVPLSSGPSELRAFVISNRLVDGHLTKLVIGPFKLAGKTLIVRTRN